MGGWLEVCNAHPHRDTTTHSHIHTQHAWAVDCAVLPDLLISHTDTFSLTHTHTYTHLHAHLYKKLLFCITPCNKSGRNFAQLCCNAPVQVWLMNGRLNYLAKGDSCVQHGERGPTISSRYAIVMYIAGFTEQPSLPWCLPQQRLWVAFNNCLYQSDSTFFLHFAFSALFKYSKQSFNCLFVVVAYFIHWYCAGNWLLIFRFVFSFPFIG